MSSLFQAITTNDAQTTNGAVTHSTSHNSVLDLFFIAGASRNESEDSIKTLIQKAYVTDPLLTLKLIFWAGDCRGGLGERRFFKIALNFLRDNYPTTLKKNLNLIPFFNRWDSLYDLVDTDKNIEITDEVLDLTLAALDNKDGLAAKWCSREHSSKLEKHRTAFQKKFDVSARSYRKLIVALSNTVEQLMSAKKWDEIIYEKVPSVASNKYRTAFYKHDEARYTKYIEAVTKGETKINAGAIFPHDLYKASLKGRDAKTSEAINAQWNALPNYLEGSNERFLPVADVSGSMEGEPMAISIALSIYLSERNNSIFKDGFITFSSAPKLQFLKGTFVERVKQLEKADWGMNTDLERTFQVILDKAIESKVPVEEMPTSILIISDMEFDGATGGKTNFKRIEELYEQSGYKRPNVIFWNVNGRVGNVPVKMNQQGVALVSGASPSIVKSVLGGELNPMKVVLTTLNNSRYEKVQI